MKPGKYIDASVLSFLFIAIIWYVWAFFWWQVYGRETAYGIEILYNNPFSPVPYEVPIFPLALVYAWVSLVIFSVLYILSVFVNKRWIIWYIGMILFSASLLVLENFSGKYDFFKLSLGITMPQAGAIVLIIIWFRGLYKLGKDN